MLKNTDKNYVNFNQDDQMLIYGYTKSIWRTILVWVFIIISVGILLLIFYWKPVWYLKLTHVRNSLKNSDKVLLKDKYNQECVEEIKQYKEKSNETSLANRAYFKNKKLKYVWIEDNFEKLKTIEEQAPERYFSTCVPLANDDKRSKIGLYGKNSIQIKLTPIIILLLKEVFSPFYIFQIISCILWYNDSYYYFASAIVFLSTTSIIYTLYILRKNEKALRNVIGKSSKALVYRKSSSGEIKIEEISEEDLVPGDIIQLKNKTILQCDALLVSGNAILNESMLTGESVPVTKIPLVTKTDRKIDFKEHNRHIIFGGTQIIQTRALGDEDVRAIVLRTGFTTSKGELVRAILYPKPADFKFNNDGYKYVGALAIIAGLGVIYSLTMKIYYKNPPEDVIKRTLDIITIAVPPILPVALTTSLVFAQSRLKKQNIYCTSPRYINLSGNINAFVFDKTGTLTEDGMDIKCIISKVDREFQHPVTNINELNDSMDLIRAMATCHSITQIDNELVGDPLDTKMLEFTKWTLDSQSKERVLDYPIQSVVKSNGEFQLGVLRQFPFSSSLQRMSVIVTDKNNFKVYCKGSPEKIAELSVPESIPHDFNEILTNYTEKGYRVIAIGQRLLQDNHELIQNIEREKIECELNLIGLMVMENRLKVETSPIIEQLKDARIRVIMCTGDNLQTALSVSRECGIIDTQDSIVVIEANKNEQPKFNIQNSKLNLNKYHLAVTGKSFEIIRDEHQDLYNKLLVKGTVFSRMSPDQKQQLIESLQSIDYLVGMCGDGANDCGALRTANAGISLSANEASVASPFTSKVSNISCVPILIKEGRCSLVSSMGIVKFIVTYSLVQFISVLILYFFNGGLTDLEFLYADLALTTLLSFFFTRTKACSQLYKIPPSNKLISWRPIISLIGHLIIIVGFQAFSVIYVTWQPWFEKYDDSPNKEEKNFASYENTIVFCLSMFQYISMAIIFSKGEPYRKMIFTNVPFIFSILITIAASLVITLLDDQGLSDFFTMKIIPDLKFRFVIVFMAILNFFISFIFETYLVENNFKLIFKANDEKLIRKPEKRCLGELKKHENINLDLISNQNWFKFDDFSKYDEKLSVNSKRKANKIYDEFTQL